MAEEKQDQAAADEVEARSLERLAPESLQHLNPPLEERASGAMALASLSESEFGARLQAVKRAQHRVRQIQAELMNAGEDFGVIPGTEKATLLKPGAEKLCAFYRLVAVFDVKRTFGDNRTRPHITVEIRADMHLGSADGPKVGEGLGSANSWEKKHRYRIAKRTCPECEGPIKRSRFEDRDSGQKGWYCLACGTNFDRFDKQIAAQDLGMVENPDPADVENTCLKVAKKRAYIDGTLTTTATSGLFSQDREGDALRPDKGKRRGNAGEDRSREAGRGAAGGRAHGEERPRQGTQGPDSPPNDRGDRQTPRQGEPAARGGDQEAAAGREAEPDAYAAAYAKHGVEPPARRPQETAAAPKGPKLNCPICGDVCGPSKYPDRGKTHYCGRCRRPFAEGEGA
jgi:hypothetical protein